MDEVEAGKYIQAHWHIPVVYMIAYPEEDAWRTRTQRPCGGATSSLATAWAIRRQTCPPTSGTAPPMAPWAWSSIRPLRGEMTGHRAPRGTNPSSTRCASKRCPSYTRKYPRSPLLLAGDEMGRTQQGNNNAYCQDNELAWLHWPLTDEQKAFCDFVRSVLQIRRTQPVFQRRKFFLSRAIYGEGIQDISWLDPSGRDMTEDTWNTGYARCLGVRLAGDLIGDMDERGEPIIGDTILLLLNAHYEAIPFTLPPLKEGQPWERLLDTVDVPGEPLLLGGEQPYALQGRSMVVLRTRPLHEEAQHTP